MGEPKFYTTFSVFSLPAPNGVDTPVWEVQLNDGDYDPQSYIFKFKSDLTGLIPQHANASPITYYGMAPAQHDPAKKVFIGNRWNLQQPMQLYMGDGDPKRCRITFGTSDAQHMAEDTRELLGGGEHPPPPTAIRVYQSPIAAVEGRAFYAF